jgi:hypothetical protein
LNQTRKRQLNLLNKGKVDHREVQTQESQVLIILVEAEIIALVLDVQIRIMTDAKVIDSQHYINKRCKNPLLQVKDFLV